MKKKDVIAVGMSGGIDSTMAAFLLRCQGYEVIGLTMSIWDGSVALAASSASGCFGPGEVQEIERARELAARIGIPHHVIRLAGEYRHNVIDYFCREYRCGRTPNPCVVCNNQIKFGLLPGRAREMGLQFDRFATGHYARIRHDAGQGVYRLLRGIDRDKEQSYFLARLTQQQLAGLIFPLGDRYKKDVIALARQSGFEDIAAEPESQDFIEGADYSALFSPEDSGSGPVVDLQGRLLGRHRGIIHYTIGQRGGLGVCAGERMYVKELRPETNTVVLAPRDALLGDAMIVEQAHWIAGQPESQAECRVQLRYRHRGVKSRIERIGDNRWNVVFHEPQFAVTPGQAAVFYREEECIGAAWIARSL